MNFAIIPISKLSFKLAFTPLLIFLVGCGDSFKLPSSSNGDGNNNDLNQDYLNVLSATVATMSVSGNNLFYDTTQIATMNNNAPVNSAYGEYVRGRTLNVLNIEGLQFIVYGNNGARAVECTPSILNPEFGPSNENCSEPSVQTFDRFVVCAPRIDGYTAMFAQQWPGELLAFEPGRGLLCWTNGVPEKSERMFTF